MIGLQSYAFFCKQPTFSEEIFTLALQREVQREVLHFVQGNSCVSEKQKKNKLSFCFFSRFFVTL